MPRFTEREFADFSGLLASVVERGMDLVPAFDLLVEQGRQRGVREALSGAREALREGVPLPDALGAAGFPAEYCALVRAGQDAGRLAEVLRSVETYHSLRARVSRQMRRLGAYLATGLCFFLLVMGFVRMWGQRFGESWVALNIAPTLVDRVTMWFLDHWWAIVAVVGLLVAGCLAGIRWIQRATRLGRVAYWIPAWGRIQRSRDLAIFCTALALRIRAGAALPQALESAAQALPNAWSRGIAGRVTKRVREGESLSTALFYENFFPRTLAWAVSLGESRNDVPGVVASFARLYSSELERNFEVLLQVLTPLGILAMGNLVFLAVMLVLIPLISIFTKLGA
jgi:general secretion pathway protein F